MDKAQPGLSAPLGLRYGQDGPAFEAALGDFLKWQRGLPLSARYLAMGFPAGRLPVGADQWREQAEFLAGQATTTLRETLYEQFGLGRIDSVLARDAYGALLDLLPLNPGGGVLTVATTNYDVSAETAMAELGRRPDVGEVDGPRRTRQLEPEGLLGHCGHLGVAVLHLHGKVGWYAQADGTVVAEPNDRPYSASAGTPAVLFPDPQKDPASEPAVRALWDEFATGLSQATHVLFVGHSLNDQGLLGHVRRYAGSARLAVTVLPGAPEAERARVAELLPGASVVEMSFGPRLQVDDKSLQEWHG